jgi:hypothetical protein
VWLIVRRGELRLQQFHLPGDLLEQLLDFCLCDLSADGRLSATSITRLGGRVKALGLPALPCSLGLALVALTC